MCANHSRSQQASSCPAAIGGAWKFTVLCCREFVLQYHNMGVGTIPDSCDAPSAPPPSVGAVRPWVLARLLGPGIASGLLITPRGAPFARLPDKGQDIPDRLKGRLPAQLSLIVCHC